jgi:hypothetical protein
MFVAADTHVHLYPCYDVSAALRFAAENLAALSSDSCPESERVGVLFLTERRDCSFFEDLKRGKLLLAGWKIEVLQDGVLRLLGGSSDGALLVAPGRQIVTRERLEVLGLAMAGLVMDGLPAEETLARIRGLGGVAVLNWSPGKWFFGRGLVVRKLIEESAPADFLIGDIAMRPSLWLEPRLMRLARRRGFGLAAGSDPLPFAGEERKVGSFGMAGRAELSMDAPLESLRELLRRAEWKAAGKRDSVPAMLWRQFCNYRARRG